MSLLLLWWHEKVLENWLYWIVINSVSIYLYIDRDLDQTRGNVYALSRVICPLVMLRGRKIMSSRTDKLLHRVLHRWRDWPMGDYRLSESPAILEQLLGGYDKRVFFDWQRGFQSGH